MIVFPAGTGAEPSLQASIQRAMQRLGFEKILTDHIEQQFREYVLLIDSLRVELGGDTRDIR